LDRASSRFETEQIQLVYATESPRLGLVWRWRARAGYGPIEHSLSIQNLSNETVWLPLQPSFRFDWMIDPGGKGRRLAIRSGHASRRAARRRYLAVHVEHLRSPRREPAARDDSLSPGR